MTYCDWRRNEIEILSDILDIGRDRKAEANPSDHHSKPKYLILSTPGAGAEHIGACFRRIGKGGVPFNYFQPKLLKIAGHPERKEQGLFRYFTDLTERRSGPDGCFGMILQFGHFEKLFGSNSESLYYGIAFLEWFDRIIWVRQSDKLLQAIKAERLCEIDFAGKGKKAKKIDLDQMKIYSRLARRIKQIIDQEYQWQTLLAKTSIKTLTIDHSLFCKEMNTELISIFSFLDIAHSSKDNQNCLPNDIDLSYEHKLKQRFIDYISGKSINLLTSIGT